MTNIEVLKVKKQGISFATPVIDLIKEKYSELLTDDLTLDYVESMIQDVIGDNLLLRFNFRGIIESVSGYKYIEYSSRSKTLEKVGGLEKVTLTVDRDYYNNTYILNNFYVLKDIQAYSDYLINLEQESLEKDIKSFEERIEKRRKDIENEKADNNRKIELGISLEDNDKLKKVKAIEILRGTKVTKEELTEVLDAAYTLS